MEYVEGETLKGPMPVADALRLAAHDEAFKAFRAASDAFEAAVAGLRATLDAVQSANHAQGEAIDGMRAANQAALRLLRQSNGQ